MVVSIHSLWYGQTLPVKPTWRFWRVPATRAGIPDTGGVNDWRGFHRLGLCLALHHKTPDATIPLLYWNQNGWQPLVRRP